MGISCVYKQPFGLSVLINSLLVINLFHWPALCDTDFLDENVIQNEDTLPVIEGYGGIVTIPEEADVLVLNKENFHHVIGTKTLILVEFYAPWCGHCKALESDYSTAASVLKKDGIPIAKIDATVEEGLAKEFDVTGFPTIKLFKKGSFYEDYDDARTSSAIIEYMKKHADPNYKPPPSSVKVLTSSNFSSFVDSEVLSLVEFYAPWCGHCKSLAPEYEGAAQDLLAGNILLAKVDATEEKDLAKKYGVSGYPRLFVFRSGQQYEFHGPRNRAGIVDYMKEHAKPPSTLMKSITSAKNKIQRTEPTIFSFFVKENDVFNTYISAANHLRDDYIFLHTFDDVIAKKFQLNLNSVSLIYPEIFHSKYEKKIKEFDMVTGNAEDLSKWVSDNIIPLVGQRMMSNMEKRYSKRPLLVVYYDVNFSHQYLKDTQFIRNKILPVANAYRDITFAISKEGEYVDELKSLGLEDSGEDVNVAIFGENNLKYPMKPDENFDSESLEEFVLAYKKGHIKPFLKSQPIPKRQDGPVKVVVANNFEKEVITSEKDILIEFYAPWCGHCKKLEPIYKKLAKHFSKENPNLVIAKMDATANDVHPHFKVEGFPTIFLLKASAKESPIPFQGSDRTFDGFKEFLSKHLKDTSSHSKDEL